MMSDYYKFELTMAALENMPLEEFSTTAMRTFEADGLESFAINEKEVDEILGSRAFCGGEITREVLEEVDRVVSTDLSTCMNVYFSGRGSDEKSELFSRYLKENNIAYVLHREQNQDWNEEWKKSFKKISITQNFCVVPSWDKSKDHKEKYILRIYPGQGFGTGSHETTFLCLSLYTKYFLKSDWPIKVMDYGCGSGVLGLATMLVNRDTFVSFYDIDKSAIENTAQNIEVNNISMQSCEAFIAGEKEPAFKTYEIVFANILEDVLLTEAKRITSLVAEQGHLIVSGILNDQVEGILSVYRTCGFSIIEVVSKNDWSAILFKR